ARNADALAPFHQHMGERKADHKGAVELGLPHLRRGEGHGGRAVDPDPDRVRGLPFALAHIEMVVTRRAAPIDPAGRLARHEAAILPEILAWAGAAAAMQAMDGGRSDAAGLQDQPRHGSGERLAVRRRPLYRLDVLVVSRLRRRHSSPDA